MKSIPFPSSSSLIFIDVITEVCKKVGVSSNSISLATPGGIVLVASAYFIADYWEKNPTQIESVQKIRKITRISTIKPRIDKFVFGDPNEQKGITQADYAKLAIYSGGVFGKLLKPDGKT